MKKQYEIRYQKISNNLNFIQLELKDKIILYINLNKQKIDNKNIIRKEKKWKEGKIKKWKGILT